MPIIFICTSILQGCVLRNIYNFVMAHCVTQCSVMLHAAFQIWGCHIWACREHESELDKYVKSEVVGIKTVETYHYRSTFYQLNPRSVTMNMKKIRPSKVFLQVYYNLIHDQIGDFQRFNTNFLMNFPTLFLKF